MSILPSETTAGFLGAARERFAEATLLLDKGHLSGAVYVFGYVGELVIKALAFRHYGYGPHDPIVKTDRLAIESLMRAHSLAPQGPHDSLRWAKWVTLMKGPLTGAPYVLQTSTDIEYHAGIIDIMWTPSLRYHVIQFPFADVLMVQQSARWLLDEEPNL